MILRVCVCVSVCLFIAFILYYRLCDWIQEKRKKEKKVFDWLACVRDQDLCLLLYVFLLSFSRITMLFFTFFLVNSKECGPFIRIWMLTMKMTSIFINSDIRTPWFETLLEWSNNPDLSWNSISVIEIWLSYEAELIRKISFRKIWRDIRSIRFRFKASTCECRPSKTFMVDWSPRVCFSTVWWWFFENPCHSHLWFKLIVFDWYYCHSVQGIGEGKYVKTFQGIGSCL